VFPDAKMMQAMKVTARPASIPKLAFGEVFRFRDLGYGCRRIVGSPEEAEVFTTRSSVSKLLNGQPPYANLDWFTS
jgi:hypothetical protein